MNSFSEVTNESWFSRITESIKGVLLGIVFFIIAFPLLFWNEGRAVDRAKTLAEGAGTLRADVSPDTVDPDNDSQLVHMTGEATSDETLTDEQFGVMAENVIKLVRTVEMYQWQEDIDTKKKKKTGGGTQTTKTYSYEKVWSNSAIDSANFNQAYRSTYGDGNPPMPFEGTSLTASRVGLGAFTLSPSLVGKINTRDQLPITAEMLESLPEEQAGQWRLDNGRFYKGDNPSTPAIGDVRVSFSVVKPTTVSLIAEQTRDTFRPYQAKSAKGTIELLQIGAHSSEAMIQKAVSENNMMTWILRGVGFGLMAFGIGLVFRPLVVVADVLPILGNLLGAGVGIFAVVIAAGLSLVTIAIGWIFYRPLLGIILLAVAALIVGGAIVLFRKRSVPNTNAPY